MRDRWGGDEGFGYTVIGWDLEDYDGTAADEALETLRALNAPAGKADCAKELARLTVLTKTRAEDRDDTKFRLAVLADELSNYPLDAVRGACRDWAASQTFFPSWHDLKALCEERTMKRRCLLRALERYWRAA